MKIYAMVPTYNEKGNIDKLITQLLKIPNLHPLIVDDNSPDGTAEAVRKWMKKNKRVELLLRTKNKGRGSAGIDGFKQCLKKNADYIIEMDADLSHDPKYIPAILEGLKRCDVILGSRYAQGGSQKGRPIRRQILTFFANLYIRIILGVKVSDCNSGYRGFTRLAMQKIMDKPLKAKGPDIVQEVLYRAHLKKLRICEIAITFNEREEGTSKLGLNHLYKGYIAVLRLKFDHLIGRI